jgi:hypothetical protein
MRITRKVAATGLASFAAIAGIVLTPLSAPVGALSVDSIKEPQKLKLDTSSNAKVDVNTDVDCGWHTLTARVTNKTSASIHPNVTFDGKQPTPGGPVTEIKPGETVNYVHNFTGNRMPVEVTVEGDTIGTVESSPMISCLEPVTFKATDWSDSAVVGSLQNNSTLSPQVVHMQVNGGDVRTVTLEPGEFLPTVALPIAAGSSEPVSASVKVEANGLEGRYLINLDELPPLPPVPVVQ